MTSLIHIDNTLETIQTVKSVCEFLNRLFKIAVLRELNNL
jgi:hypothetical protein